MTTFETNLLFPSSIIPALGEARGAAWQGLVECVTASGAGSDEEAALVLVMARLSSCATCSIDSYRAMHGCTPCAQQALKRFHETDEALIELFRAAQAEVEAYLGK